MLGFVVLAVANTFVIGALLAAVVWLVWRTWRQAMSRPAHDPDPEWPEDPDRDALVDETAGPFTDAPDPC